MLWMRQWPSLGDSIIRSPCRARWHRRAMAVLTNNPGPLSWQGHTGLHTMIDQTVCMNFKRHNDVLNYGKYAHNLQGKHSGRFRPAHLQCILRKMHCVQICVQIYCIQYIETNLFNLQLQWRHNGRDCVSNHQPHDRLLNRLFRRRSKKISKLRVIGLCAGNSPGTGEFPAQMASDAEMFPFDDVIMVCYTLELQQWSPICQFILVSVHY